MLALIQTRRVVSLSGQYLAPTPNFVSLDATVQSMWTAVSSLLLIRWKTDPANSEPSLLSTAELHHSDDDSTSHLMK